MKGVLKEQPGEFEPAPHPPNEKERLAALRALDILDSAEEDIYNAITQAAADTCQTPMANLSFIDEKRQWFKAKIGFAMSEVPREITFCSYAINGPEMLLVPDATKDPRFRNNPGVTGDPHVRFYAGMPLRTQSGLALGTLCVADTVPRSLNEAQKGALEALAESAMRVVELRRNIGVAVFAKTVDMTSDGVTVADYSGGEMTVMYANESFLKLTGLEFVHAINQSPTFPMGADCPSLQQAFAEAARDGQMRTVECRFRRKDGEFVWDRVTYVPHVDHKHRLKYLVTVHRDVTSLREAEAQAQHLYAMRTTMASVAHVVKNFLNAAQLYSTQVSARGGMDPAMQSSFMAALENVRSQMAASDRMQAFRERKTPFGFSILNTDEKN